MTQPKPPLTLDEVKAMAKAAGLRLSEAELQQLHGEVADLLPRLLRLEDVDLAGEDPDWVRPPTP
jgi:Asp-tRNA(Asn)/Glu-tRNA(Gln) amidotransferase C subunit